MAKKKKAPDSGEASEVRAGLEQLAQHPLKGIIAQLFERDEKTNELLNAVRREVKQDATNKIEKQARKTRAQMQEASESQDSRIGGTQRLDRLRDKATCDDIVLVDGDSGDSGAIAKAITAAELNGAAAGTIKRYLTVALVTADNELHHWANFANTPVGGEAVADPDVGAPTIASNDPAIADPEFRKGEMKLEVTFDTAASGKDYVAAETLTVTVDVSSIPIFGNMTSGNSRDLVFTWTVT